jgi:hypothetical protein
MIKIQSAYPIYWPKYEPVTTQIQSKYVIPYTTMFDVDINW